MKLFFLLQCWAANVRGIGCVSNNKSENILNSSKTSWRETNEITTIDNAHNFFSGTRPCYFKVRFSNKFR